MCDNNYINIQDEYDMKQEAEYMVDSILNAIDEVKKLNVEADNLCKKILSAYEELHKTYVDLSYKKSND